MENVDKKSFLTATHWGVYRAEVDDGRLVEMHSFEEDRDPSAIGKGLVDAINSSS